jgi:PIN domain nuclease of toxin-antitoxin system
MLLTHDYRELPVKSEHTIAGGDLPPLHKDPFDRLLIAQARVEGLTLLTTDTLVALYGEPTQLV